MNALQMEYLLVNGGGQAGVKSHRESWEELVVKANLETQNLAQTGLGNYISFQLQVNNLPNMRIIMHCIANLSKTFQ